MSSVSHRYFLDSNFRTACAMSFPLQMCPFQYIYPLNLPLWINTVNQKYDKTRTLSRVRALWLSGGTGLVNLVKLSCPYKRTYEFYQVVSARMYSPLKSMYHPDATEEVPYNHRSYIYLQHNHTALHVVVLLIQMPRSSGETWNCRTVQGYL